MLDLSLFKIRAYTAVTVGGALGTTSTAIVVFLAMVFFQDVDDLSSLQAGFAFVTFSIGYAVGALASGRFGRFEPWLVMASALAVGGIGTVGLGLSIGYLPVFVVIGLFAGTGLGLAFNYLNVVSQSVIPARLAGGASGTALTMLVMANAIALAIAVSIFDTVTSPSGLSDSTAISAIFVAAGLVSLASAGLVAVMGRDPGSAAAAGAAGR